MDIGRIRTGGVYQPGEVRGDGAPRSAGDKGAAKRETLSVGISRANPLEEAPVTPEVEADLRRDDDIGLLLKTAYCYQPPEMKVEKLKS